jgi:hypothetical protein
MKSKWYVWVIVGLVMLLAGSWGYFGWHFSQDQKRDKGVVAAEIQTDPVVKKSSYGICHDKNSKYYTATKNFEAFQSMDECLSNGGRLPY